MANPYRFSYPGYNEIFTGYPDPEIFFNAKVQNPNTNVLEYINQQPEFHGKVAAFSSWDVIPYILNEERSGLYVNSDEAFEFDSPQISILNDLKKFCSRPLDVRPDVLTYFGSREYLKAFRPRVLYIGFDETDDFAHAGMYDQYIKSAHAEDAMLADLWSWIQQTPGYANQTTMVITCDHGRGDKIKDEWTSHSDEIPEAGEIWMAIIGPDIAKKGEMHTTPALEQGQLAATFAALLGLSFTADHPVMASIETMLGQRSSGALTEIISPLSP
ncbi:MAG: alkaline phosphatase family protein [Saprospiraceae bacterium]